MKKTAAFLFMVLWVFGLSECVLAAAPPGTKLNVLTYNVGLLAGPFNLPIVALVDQRAALLNQVLASKVQSEAIDLVVLEEVWDDGQYMELKASFDKIGYMAFRPRPRVMLGYGSGLVIFYNSDKLRALSFEPFKRFSISTGIQKSAFKGYQRIKFSTFDHRVFGIVATHMDALTTKYGRPIDPDEVHHHAQQARELVAATRAFESKGIPALLLGDFNVGAGYVEDNYEIMSHSFEDAMSFRPMRQFSTPTLVDGTDYVTWDPNNPLVKYGQFPDEPPCEIDHIFSMNAGQSQWQLVWARTLFREVYDSLVLKGERTPLSDHYGVKAQFILH